MKKVGIIDYRLGNLFSVVQACNEVGLHTELCSSRNDLSRFDGYILPGVGSFKDAINYLQDSGLADGLINELNKGKPLFGICLGLQLLFESSEEFGLTRGLGIIKGKVKKFEGINLRGEKLRVPNIGWNQLRFNADRRDNTSPLNTTLESDYFYFIHSYFVIPDDNETVLTFTDYETNKYVSSILKDNIFATQFHPEKSGIKGLEIYRNWAKKNNLI
jgi:imidazole glycerol-phosphate synthase subunit HisH